MPHFYKTVQASIALLLAVAVGATGATAMVDSFEQTEKAVNEHKLYLDENSSSTDDGLDAEAYEHSQKAKEIAHANAKLAQLRASVIGGAK